MLTPTQPVPSLSVPLVGGGRFAIAASRPKAFTLIAVRRGYHCPVRRPLLQSQDGRFQSLTALGVAPIATRTDAEDRASKAARERKLGELPVGYALSIETARAWGLSISSAINENAPPRFAEPGVYLLRPDGTLLGESTQTMRFTAPSFADIETAVRLVLERNDPARGAA